MAEYLIIKREKCERPTSNNFDCPYCHDTGYIETKVPLLDVLRMVRVPLSNDTYGWGMELVAEHKETNE